MIRIHHVTLIVYRQSVCRQLTFMSGNASPTAKLLNQFTNTDTDMAAGRVP